MSLEREFLINDGSVNRYGYRILSSGIRTDNFLKNPVCLKGHNSDSSIGKWKNLRFEGDNFYATLEFDENDPDAVLIANKYDKGYMNACSLSMLEIADSEDPILLLPGQRYATVTDCDLLEISTATVPGNANAIKLICQNGEEKKLSLIINIDKTNSKNRDVMTKEEELKAENDQLKKQRALDLVNTHLQRGAISNENKDFFEKNAVLEYDATKKALELLPSKEDQNAGKKQLAVQLVELHQQRGAINAQQLDFYTKSAETDYEGTKKVLKAMKGTDGLGAIINNLSAEEKAEADKNDKTKWSYLDWYKNDLDGLQKMEADKPEEHKKLLLAFRGKLKDEGVYVPMDEQK